MLFGGTGNDLLLGGTGSDTLDGGDGNDQMWGNEGDDFYLIDSNDTIVEYDNEGTDTVIIQNQMFYYALDINFENLINRYGAIFHGIGNALDNKLFGGSSDDFLEGLDGDDTLAGFAGNDILSGGNGNDLLTGGAGQDTLLGGNGNDVYLISDVFDEVIELENNGVDSIRTSLNYFELSDHVENLIFAINGSYFEGYGNTLNNTIESNAALSFLFGLGGHDILLGGVGDDFLSGGQGDDQMHGDLGTDTLVYSDHAVSVDVDLGRGTTESSWGSDTFSGMENIIGGSGNDRLIGDSGANYILGGAGNDVISGDGGDDDLFGDTGDDQLSGGDGDDHLDGGEGNDVLFAGSGNDEIQGGVGKDTVSFIKLASAVHVDLESGTASSGDDIDTLSGIENISGSDHDDLIKGNALDNEISGGAGNDMLDGSLGNDTLIGNSGNDLFLDWEGANSFFGGDGDDTISYANFSVDSRNSINLLLSPIITIDLSANYASLEGYGPLYIPGISPEQRTLYSENYFSSIENAVGSNISDFIYGNSEINKIDGLDGDDLIMGGFGNDTINGGAGNDTLSFYYLNLDQYVTVSLIDKSSSVKNSSGVTLETDEVFEMENVIGSFGNDDIRGSDAANMLDGGYGSDALHGLGGDDLLIGGYGKNHIDGGDGSDTVDYRFSNKGLDGGLEYQSINRGDDVDTLISIENIIASEFGDRLSGSSRNNEIDGRNGDDFIDGLGGNDTLIGGNGNDQLSGDTGDDRLIGGEGNDQLRGGAGDDWLIDTEGSNIFDGGLGIDYADFSAATTGVSASLALEFATNIPRSNQEIIFSSNLFSIENLQGSRFDDLLEGNNKNNELNGGLGIDSVTYNYLPSGHSVEANLLTGDATIKDGNGFVNDRDTLLSIENLTGSSGNDTLTGNDQANVLVGADGADSLSGGGGNDVIYAEIKKDLLIDGGEGIDTLHIVFSSSSTGLLSNFFFMDGRSGFFNFENIVGSYASEYLSGTSSDNLIDGGLGNDEIYGRNGNDILKGGDGINFITGGSGHNIIDGSASPNSDSVSFASYEVSESLIIDLALESGNARLASSDTASFTLIDDYINIFCVRSGIGNDLISGNSQNNILGGNSGNDQIFAKGGDDILDGGFGSDMLEGGTGSDIFVFKNHRLLSSDSREDIDIILDFGVGGNDKIDLRSFDNLDANNFRINQTQSGSIVVVEGINFTQKIIVEGPLASSLNIDNFILSGDSDIQTNFFDSVSDYFALF